MVACIDLIWQLLVHDNGGFVVEGESIGDLKDTLSSAKFSHFVPRKVVQTWFESAREEIPYSSYPRATHFDTQTRYMVHS